MDDVTQPVTPTAFPASTAAAGASSPQDLAGQTIGDYRIIRTLGQGGMGAVYLAEQQSLKRKVALKFLRPEMVAHPTALSRFRREAEAVARVNHPNIVQVYAIDESGGRPYMALEYVEGQNLKRYIERKGPLKLPAALMVMRQVAAALQRAADSNIVHRDIKPENILLMKNGSVKVADFGLSRDLAADPDLSLTQDGTTMGTPLYMSPEQAQGNPLDARSDIYSLGVTCFHMLSGQPPFRGQTAIEVALKHVNEEPPSLAKLRPDLPPGVVSLVERMMSKDPARRPQSGRDVLRELSQPTGSVSTNPFAELTTAPVAAPRGSPTPAEATAAVPTAGQRRSRRWLVPALAVLLASFAGVGLRLFVNAHSTPRGRDDHPTLPIVSDQERRILGAIELFKSLNTPDKVRQAAGLYVELGVLYWEQKRYADAERLFDEMLKKPNAPPIFKSIGTLGFAVTYGLRDEVDRSNKLFLELRGSGSSAKSLIPPGSLPTEDTINLRYWAATALARNSTRPPAVKGIEELRLQMRYRPNLGAVNKPG